MKLYEIAEAIDNFEMEFDEDGVLINEDELNALNVDRDTKRENIALVIKNKEAEKQAISNEKKTFASREKTLTREIDWLKNYLAFDLKGEPFKTPRVVITFRKSESVEILNEDAVPDSYLDIKVVRTPMKDEIKKRLKEAEAKGEEIAWAKLDKKNNIQVK